MATAHDRGAVISGSLQLRLQRHRDGRGPDRDLPKRDLLLRLQLRWLEAGDGASLPDGHARRLASVARPSPNLHERNLHSGAVDQGGKRATAARLTRTAIGSGRSATRFYGRARARPG